MLVDDELENLGGSKLQKNPGTASLIFEPYDLLRVSCFRLPGDHHLELAPLEFLLIRRINFHFAKWNKLEATALAVASNTFERMPVGAAWNRTQSGLPEVCVATVCMVHALTNHNAHCYT